MGEREFFFSNVFFSFVYQNIIERQIFIEILSLLRLTAREKFESMS